MNLAMFVNKELLETLVEKFPISPFTRDTLARENWGGREGEQRVHGEVPQGV